jgi:hypothetical protein
MSDFRNAARVEIEAPGTIQLSGDSAVGRSYVSVLGQLRDGRPSFRGQTLGYRGVAMNFRCLAVSAPCTTTTRRCNE